MHLKSLKIKNFRKFGNSDCSLNFVSHATDAINKVASSATLIVGKNNTGKTTVTNALQKILDNGRGIKGSDFNYIYLQETLKQCCLTTKESFSLPIMEFEIVISVENNNENRLNNLSEFVEVDDLIEHDILDLLIKLKIEIDEVEEYKSNLEKIIKKYGESQDFKIGKRLVQTTKNGLNDYNIFNASKEKRERRKAVLFKKFIELISKTNFVMNCYNLEGNVVDSKKFNLSNLLSVKVINANSNLHDKNLSNIFNKIIKNRYQSNNEIENFEELQDEIDLVNGKISDRVSRDHNKSVNGVLHQIEFHKRLGVRLSANLDFDKLTRDLIKHEYTEQGFFIPEGQFGLGYTNLMNIIGEIIDYVEEYPTEGIQSKVNLICIEEPEAFMHPQMQESFIKYINDAVGYLLKESRKTINSQLIITTHSSHILNSKIHFSNSFNNINYINQINNQIDVVKLSDSVLSIEDSSGASGAEEKRLNDLKFLKKHIKYKVSELFFADAIIFVEGITEETLLSYYIEKDESLSKCYISILNINGAHGQVYLPLLKYLNIPTLIITDIDIKRERIEKYEVIETDPNKREVAIYPQMTTIEGRRSTNSTIHKFNGDTSAGLQCYFQDNNIYGVFQKDPISGFYATSFEEAFILHNYNNNILNKVLKAVKPQLYDDLVGASTEKENIKNNSYKIQKKLSDSKSDFANSLLYEFLVQEDPSEIPALPNYINDGLIWLKEKIELTFKGQG